MFIVDLHYIVPLDELDRHMAEHIKFLQENYKKDTFITSGRKVPRTGGIILVKAQSKEEVEAIMNKDPFIKRKLAKFTVTEFLNSQVHPKFKGLL